MPRINLIGASNLQTNNTCVFGSMAGLAPTATVRPHITILPGYKYAKAFNDNNHYSNGCGWSNARSSNKEAYCGQGKKCVNEIGFSKNVVQYYVNKKFTF
tara:strand:- start:1457 stop:1756 length:300 start_codon:yes stop_codon:yes gene_type:complete